MHNNVGNAYRQIENLNSARDHLEKAVEMLSLIYLDDPTSEQTAKVRQLFESLAGLTSQYSP